MKNMSKNLQISVTIPVFNEAENILELYEKVGLVLERLEQTYEIIFINDGSTDTSAQVLDSIAKKDKKVKVIHFRRNYGQTAAMMAGVDHAAGDIIIPMDGDLQNDPEDIPKLLAKLLEGYDVVSGWRVQRKDNPIKRNFLSRVANWLISNISGVFLHDYGCSLKAYKKEVIKGIRLYGEMHRFIPIYASWEGGKVAEVPVNHFPRTRGVSKYGMNRVVKVLLDLIVVEFLHRYSNKPIYVFGGFGIVNFLISLCSFIIMIYLKIVHDKSFVLTPMPLVVMFTFLIGILSILMGLLAEILVRTYYESQKKTTYNISKLVNFPKEERFLKELEI